MQINLEFLVSCRSIKPKARVDRTLFDRVHAFVLAQWTATDLRVGTIAEALSVTCDDVVAAISRFGGALDLDDSIDFEPSAYQPASLWRVRDMRD